MYIVLVHFPSRTEYFGPFKSEYAATRWARDNLEGVTFEIAKLEDGGE